VWDKRFLAQIARFHLIWCFTVRVTEDDGKGEKSDQIQFNRPNLWGHRTIVGDFASEWMENKPESKLQKWVAVFFSFLFFFS
jgi:hypothetical protein